MDDSDKISFHDSTVVRFIRSDDSIKLSLEDIDINGELKKACIIFTVVKNFATDARGNTGDLMSTSYGEILTFNTKNHNAKLIIEWSEFQPHRTYDNIYNFDFEDYSIEIY